MARNNEHENEPSFGELRELAGEHAEDDRVIALMMRLATVGIDLSSAGAGVKSEDDASKAEPKTNLTERLSNQHAQVDGAVNRVVTIYKAAAVSFTLFISLLLALIRFYIYGYPADEYLYDLPRFAWCYHRSCLFSLLGHRGAHAWEMECRH